MAVRLGLFVVVGTLALAVGAAGAATTTHESHFKKFRLSWKPAHVTFAGKIASPKGKCIDRRKVRVVRMRSGRKDGIGTGRTNARGKFKIELIAGTPALGKYRAIAKKRSYRRRGETIVCGRGKSPRISVIPG